MGRRGGPTVVFTLLLSFFLARFARQYYTSILHVYMLPSSMFGMERSSFLYISLIQIMKRIQLPIPCFNERVFSYCSCPELHDFTPFKQKKKIIGEDPDSPPPRHIYNMKATMASVCLYREGLAIIQQTMPYRKINLNVKNCLESRFKPYFCRRERTTTTFRFLS